MLGPLGARAVVQDEAQHVGADGAGGVRAHRLVEHYSGDEPEVLKQDFYLSLLAAFEPEEVEEQLAAAGLSGLSVKVVSDRHLIVFGEGT